MEASTLPRTQTNQATRPPQLIHHSSSAAQEVYGPSSHISFVNNAHTTRVRPSRCGDLVRKPTIRQWIVGGKLYRESIERSLSKFELFFDLLFAGIVHQLSDSANESPTGAGLAKFILTFYPSWSVWSDVRNFLNASGMDDLPQRFYILLTMMLLVGYTASASAIEFFVHHSESSEEENDYSKSAVRATVAFFLVAKLLRLILFLVYAFYLPPFRPSQLFNAAHLVAVSLVYLGVYFAFDNPHPVVIMIVLPAIGQVMDMVPRYVIGLVPIIWRSNGQRTGNGGPDSAQPSPKGQGETSGDEGEAEETQPATLREEEENDYGRVLNIEELKRRRMLAFPVNIEHYIERNTGFITIVLGESVINLLYKASGTEIGLSVEYARAILGLLISFNLNFIYFVDTDTDNNFVHALRRSWFTALSYSNAHWLLAAGIIIASSPLSTMVAQADTTEADVGRRWFFGGGVGTAIISMTLLALMHRSLEPPGYTHVDRRIRLLVRFLAGVLCILIPLIGISSNVGFLGVYAGITTFVGLFETFGGIRRKDAQIPPGPEGDAVRKLEEEEAEEMEREREAVIVEDLTEDTEMDGRSTRRRSASRGRERQSGDTSR